MSKLWTLLGKEEQFKDMNPPRSKGESIDDMDRPWKRWTDDDTIIDDRMAMML